MKLKEWLTCPFCGKKTAWRYNFALFPTKILNLDTGKNEYEFKGKVWHRLYDRDNRCCNGGYWIDKKSYHEKEMRDHEDEYISRSVSSESTECKNDENSIRIDKISILIKIREMGEDRAFNVLQSICQNIIDGKLKHCSIHNYSYFPYYSIDVDKMEETISVERYNEINNLTDKINI